MLIVVDASELVVGLGVRIALELELGMGVVTVARVVVELEDGECVSVELFPTVILYL